MASIRIKEELQKASEHLAYEIFMFNATAERLIAGTYKNTVEKNALLEAFTVHARVLVQFFSPSFRARDDDVIAAHYITDWTSKCPALPAALDKVNERVGKEIAHLTYTRFAVTPVAKGWNVTEMAQAMDSVVQKFVANVALDSLSPSWKITRLSPSPEYAASTTTPTVLFPATVISSPSATNAIRSTRTRPPFDEDPT